MRHPLVILALCAGCSDGASFVVVDVGADAPVDGIVAFAGDAAAGARHARFTVAVPGGSVSLNPATQSFAIEVPAGLSGNLHLSLDAVDSESHVLAAGSGDVTIKSHGRIDLPLTLAVIVATPPDLAMPPDLATPPDMAPTPDLAPPAALLQLTAPMSSFDFGSAARGTAGGSITLTATNVGSVATGSLQHATFTGASNSFFVIDESSCLGAKLAPNDSCTVQVQFKPQLTGVNRATLLLGDGATASGSADLTGTGTPVWDREPLPPPTMAETAPPLTVAFTNGSDGSRVYAAGGSTFYVRDGSGAWVPFDITLGGQRPTTIGQGWATGHDPVTVFLATDIGLLRSTAPGSWTLVGMAAPLHGVIAFSDQAGWATTDAPSGNGWLLEQITGASLKDDVTVTSTYGWATFWGSSDSDVWLAGAFTDTNGLKTPAVWRRDASGTWSAPQQVGHTCTHCQGNHFPFVEALWGFGAPATIMYATSYPIAPAMWSGGAWTELGNVPIFSANGFAHCRGVWGASPSSVWFACDSGMYLYTGNDTWDDNAKLDVNGFSAVCGASAKDVYAVGSSAGAGIVYHYH
jgi:hypothetical protein